MGIGWAESRVTEVGRHVVICRPPSAGDNGQKDHYLVTEITDQKNLKKPILSHAVSIVQSTTFSFHMEKGKPRTIEKGVLGHSCDTTDSQLVGCGIGSLDIPPAPAFYPTDDEFKDPLECISKIHPQASAYGICRIVTPKS
ncbi:putative lysine-specific demethylase ELF6 [Dendrobium catenatum]|uniref:Putative lysine-specific demethylase ELF6 n=1 Tax=Dendrobium catenatum TaxID=906689 RepID=A0A2I0X9Y3_9ASPA|nr:putative lysine-specific demethylase ELF6 [Dendrobium catenatum]